MFAMNVPPSAHVKEKGEMTVPAEPTKERKLLPRAAHVGLRKESDAGPRPAEELSISPLSLRCVKVCQ